MGCTLAVEKQVENSGASINESVTTTSLKHPAMCDTDDDNTDGARPLRPPPRPVIAGKKHMSLAGTDAIIDQMAIEDLRELVRHVLKIAADHEYKMIRSEMDYFFQQVVAEDNRTSASEEGTNDTVLTSRTELAADVPIAAAGTVIESITDEATPTTAGTAVKPAAAIPTADAATTVESDSEKETRAVTDTDAKPPTECTEASTTALESISEYATSVEATKAAPESTPSAQQSAANPPATTDDAKESISDEATTADTSTKGPTELSAAVPIASKASPIDSTPPDGSADLPLLDEETAALTTESVDPPLLRKSRSHDIDFIEEPTVVLRPFSENENATRVATEKIEEEVEVSSEATPLQDNTTPSKSRSYDTDAIDEPTAGLRRTQSQEGIELEDATEKTRKAEASKEMDSLADQIRNSQTKSNASRNVMAGSNRSNQDKTQLIVLCNRKPATTKECKDQDLAMKLCKKIGVVPRVILSEIPAGKTNYIYNNPAATSQEERLVINSMIVALNQCSESAVQSTAVSYSYPQFFVRFIFEDKNNNASNDMSRSSSNAVVGAIEYKGDYDTMEELHRAGMLTKESLFDEIPPACNPMDASNETNDTNSAFSDRDRERLELLIRETTELTRKLNGESGSGVDGGGENKVTVRDGQKTKEPLRHTHIRLASVGKSNQPLPSTSSELPLSSTASTPTARPGMRKSMPHQGANTIALPSGVTVKRETVTLKPRRQSLQKEPSGANLTTSLTQARGSLQSPSSRQQPSTSVLQPVVEQPKRRIMNPYYALQEYGGSERGKETQGTPSQADHQTEDFSVARLPEDPMEIKEDPPELSAPYDQVLDERDRSWEKRFVGKAACYLVFNTSDDELNIHYSERPLACAVGVWTSRNIEAFKTSQGLSESELIGTCASNVTNDHKNYYQGWCQFAKAAKSMGATVTLLEGYGVSVDLYLYDDSGRTIQISAKNAQAVFNTTSVDAVACVPRGCDFPMSGIAGKKWGKIAKKLGAVAVFKSLSSKSSKINRGDNQALEQPVIKGEASTHISSVESNQNEVVPVVLDEEIPSSSIDHEDESSPISEPNGEAEPATELATELRGEPEAEPEPPEKLELEPEPEPEPREVEELDPAAEPSSSTELSDPERGACYLVYNPDSSGQIVEHYSRTPIDNAIGRWIPGPGKKIANFKFTRNVGRNVLIGNCSAGVQGRKNYSSGWCQFVRSAKLMEADIMLWDPKEGQKGLKVDIYLYNGDPDASVQTIRLKQGILYKTDDIDAVACVPKNTPFYEDIKVDDLMWLQEGSKHGYSTRVG